MTSLAELGAVVLAAGRSSRMQDEHKLLKMWRGRPLLAHCLSTVAGLKLSCVRVVTGARGDEMRELAEAAGLDCIDNPEYASGVSGSIARGVAAMPAGVQGAFIVLGDMPLVQRSDFEALAAAFSPDQNRDICVLLHRGRRGHPVLFGRRMFPEMLKLHGDRGAADVITRHPDRIAQIEGASEGSLIDLDTPHDFERLGVERE